MTGMSFYESHPGAAPARIGVYPKRRRAASLYGDLALEPAKAGPDMSALAHSEGVTYGEFFFDPNAAREAAAS